MGQAPEKTVISGDTRVECPVSECPTGMTLTEQGARMALASELACSQHGELLVVVQR